MENDGEYMIKANEYPNLKGVMLCARPEEKQNIEKDRPFCSRVDPKDQLGVNPIQKFRELKTKKNPKYIQMEHKRWLKNFEQEMQNRKYEAYQDRLDEIAAFQRVRKKGERMRKWAKEGKLVSSLIDKQSQIQHREIGEEFHPSKNIDYNDIIDSVINDIGASGKVVQMRPPAKRNDIRIKKGNFIAKSSNKTKRKPAWAMTEEQKQEAEFEEDEEILDFMDDFDCYEYMADVEVKNIVSEMKDRVSKIEDNYSRDYRSHNDYSEYGSQEQGSSVPSGQRAGNKSQPRMKNILKNGGRGNLGQNPFGEDQLKVRGDRGKKIFKKKKKYVTFNGTEDPYTEDDDVLGHRSPEIMEKIIENVVSNIIKSNPDYEKVQSRDKLKSIIEKQVKKILQKKEKNNEKRMQFRHLRRPQNYHMPRYAQCVNLEPNMHRPGYKKLDKSFIKKNDSVQNLPYLYRNPAI